jgi:protein SCO1/2
MRIVALMIALLLAGCSRPSWHMTDISGAMPRLDFHMVKEGDELVSAKDYRGKVVALYFGYTHCPDVCPTTLANLADVIARVKSSDFRVLFVTVDPDRDGGPSFTQYTQAFSKQIDGLRGNSNQLAALARTYRVAYTVKKGPPYEVMHSNAVFFFDRDGKARLVTTDTSDAAGMAQDVKRLLD